MSGGPVNAPWIVARPSLNLKSRKRREFLLKSSSTVSGRYFRSLTTTIKGTSIVELAYPD